MMRAALFGHNKKRKRNEVEGLDDDNASDDLERMKMERL